MANVTRALAATDDPELAAELVAERRALRGEMQALDEIAARATSKATSIAAASFGRRG